MDRPTGDLSDVKAFVDGAQGDVLAMVNRISEGIRALFRSDEAACGHAFVAAIRVLIDPEEAQRALDAAIEADESEADLWNARLQGALLAARWVQVGPALERFRAGARDPQTLSILQQAVALGRVDGLFL